MTLDQVLDHALSKPGAEETLPFGPDVLVVKFEGRAFIMIRLDSSPLQFNLKCDPDRSIELREEHASILPGYHMNKRHWNTLLMDGSLPDRLVKDLIDHSYGLVAVKGRPSKRKRD